LSTNPASANPLLHLLGLARRARAAASGEELAFLAVNDSHALQPYRQAALWFADGGIKALSGVVQPEANAPYVQWLERVCHALPTEAGHAVRVSSAMLPPPDAAEWPEWLPEFGLWLTIAGNSEHDGAGRGGLLLAAEQPWPEQSLPVMEEWMDAWRHAWFARQKSPALSGALLRRRAAAWLAPRSGLPWWRQGRIRAAAAVVAVLIFPVRLSVLAPGELVPANPVVIRAPVDGVVGEFHVRPNEAVTAGQPLFGFDEAPVAARLEVASQTLATAQTEYRQFAQQAVADTRSKAQLAILLGKIEEKRAEADYLRGQLDRARVVAPQDGIVLFDDPSEWIGRPVQTGERIMRVAAPGDVEVEAWLPVGDAIPLAEGTEVELYLAANPLSSLGARVRYAAHDATPRPEGIYAYRLRARLDAATDQRVGLKGTAKVSGARVPLIYWILRRPLATVRQTLGL
jgi:multidrug resistance efflux pump